MNILKLFKKQKKGYHTKAVGQYKNGILIKKYNSLNEVERKKGYARGHISECCSGKRYTAYGYEWEYMEE